MPVALEWGPAGAVVLADTCDVLVVVDVLSFTTTVTIAVENGAEVWPHPGGEGAGDLATEVHAELAGSRGSGADVTLSPSSVVDLVTRRRIVLPSPNGSAICSSASDGDRPVVAGCLRNAAAVARHVAGAARVALVPAGERWADGTLRPAYEDLVGAGAIAQRLREADPRVELGPEAEAAALAFLGLRPLEQCPSGMELVDRGFAEDVRLAAEVDVSTAVPVLSAGRFVAAPSSWE